MLGFNIVDVIIVLFMIAWVAHGYRIGFLMGTVDLTGFLASASLAAVVYPLVSGFLNSSFGLPRSFTNLISYLALFASFHILVFYGLGKLHPFVFKSLHHVRLSKIDRIAGVFPTAIGGFIWLALILGILTWFPVSTYAKMAIMESRIGSPLVRTASQLEPRVEQIAGGAIHDTIGFLTTSREDGREWKPNIPESASASFDTTAENYMVILVNIEREQLGLQTLRFDAGLREAARLHSLDMVKNNFFDHTSPTTGSPADRLRAARVPFFLAGENLAYAQNVDLAHEGLMESDGHRANILHPSYSRIGIGIVNAGPYGYMCTQEFAR